MAKRPDFDAVTKAVEKKHITLKQGKEWLSLPIMDIPFGGEFGAYHVANRMKGQNIMEAFVTEGFYFEDFVIAADAADAVATRIRVISRGEKKSVEFTIFAPEVPEGLIQFELHSGGISPDGLEVYGISTQQKGLGELLLDSNPKHEEITKMLANKATFSLETLCLFRDYNNQKDNYLVRVDAEKKPKTKGIPTPREQLRVTTGPRVIYLNRLPVTKEEAERIENGEPQPMIPHRRRGYWVTLKAERYRYHPKYLIEKGFYRKESWVGERVAIVDGNIYTILE